MRSEPPSQFATSEVDLNHAERMVLSFVARAAEAQRELESNEEIADQLGFDGTGTIRGIMLRLERKGYVEIRSYQRGRQVYHKGLQLWTAAPPCTVPHWRTIYDRSVERVPSQPQASVQQFPTIMSVLDQLMKAHNLTFANAQIMLMSHGVSALAAQQGA
jgi:hypothetical protein